MLSSPRGPDSLVRTRTMKRSVLALFLLSTLLFGWVAGPRSCHMMAGGERSNGHASCHEMPSKGGASTVQRAASLEAQGCCDVACQHACHLVAVLSINPVVVTATPLSQKPAERPRQSAPVIAFRIDHIPLA